MEHKDLITAVTELVLENQNLKRENEKLTDRLEELNSPSPKKSSAATQNTEMRSKARVMDMLAEDLFGRYFYTYYIEEKNFDACLTDQLTTLAVKAGVNLHDLEVVFGGIFNKRKAEKIANRNKEKAEEEGEE